MGSIREHGNGWQVRYRQGPGGRQKGPVFDTWDDADAWNRRLGRVGWEAAEHALAVSDPRTTPTLRVYAEAFIRAQTGIEEQTRRKDLQLMSTWGPELLDLPVSAITRPMVAAWVNRQSAAGYAGKTIANRHAKLSQVLTAAVEDDHLVKQPAKGMKLPKSLRSEPVFLTPEQIHAILAHLDPFYHPLVAAMLATGMRFQEATAVTWGSIDLAGGTIRVRQAWKQQPGGHYVGTTKTRRSTRTVQLFGGPPVIELLREHRAVTRGLVGDLAFRTAPSRRWPEGGKRIGDSWRSGKFHAAVVAAELGLDPHPTPHDLRHTHASMLIAEGHSLTLVQHQLGHETIQITSDTYGHLRPNPFRGKEAGADAFVAGALES